MSYTKMQQEYIDSVGGNAHHIAVDIIGQLEHEIASPDAASHPHIRMIGKEEIPKYLGRHPDHPDMMMFAFADSLGAMTTQTQPASYPY